MHLLWSRSLPGTPRGLQLAREKNWILAWDENHWLHLLDHRGERQAQVRTANNLAAACCSDEGSAYVAVGSRGEVWWLAPDLTTRWERAVPRPAVAAALDSFGQYLAVSDNGGQVSIFDRLGRQVCTLNSPKPLVHLAFAAAKPILVGAAEYGLVAAFDLEGRWLWRDGLVAHIGALALRGDGEEVLLACFSEGVLRYGGGNKQGRLAVSEPCRLVSVSFDGQRVLVAGLTDQLHLLDAAGTLLASHQAETNISASVLSPLGDFAVAALADGAIVKLGLK